jgi:hypothetical protein
VLRQLGLITLTGAVLTGMTGPTASGGGWRIGRGLLIRGDSTQSAVP